MLSLDVERAVGRQAELGRHGTDEGAPIRVGDDHAGTAIAQGMPQLVFLQLRVQQQRGGLKPGGRHLTVRDAIKTADSWGYFACDMVGALPQKALEDFYK